MILLIGNISSKFGLNPTAIEDLFLELQKKYKVKIASSKSFRFSRLIDMLSLVYLNRKKCQIIILDVFSTKAFYFSAGVILLAKYLRLNCIPVFRGGNLSNRYEKNKRLFNYLYRDSIIICPSSFIGDYFKKEGFKIQVVPNYIDLSNYNFKLRENFRPKLLWVRSLHKIYNPTMAIDVLAEIIKKYPDAELCMVGPSKDDSLYKIKRKVEKLNLQNNIIITGGLSKDRWIELSEKYDIFINTTNFDNQPVTLIEAMALGMPVVSTNAGGIIKLIIHKENGLLVDKEDAINMVSYINRLIEDSNLGLNISKNARLHVEKLHSKEKVMKEWFRIIKEQYGS